MTEEKETLASSRLCVSHNLMEKRISELKITKEAKAVSSRIPLFPSFPSVQTSL